jgi:hypothetical protein
MASEFPGRPRLQKGALLVYGEDTPGAQPTEEIILQFNPEQLRRSFAARVPQRDPGSAAATREDVRRVVGPPVETISLGVLLDAADQVGEPSGDVRDAHGLHPALAVLELLLFPPSARIDEIERQAEQGAVQVTPAEVPLVLFAWGRSRVVPVQLTSMSVTEQLFDPMLNPIRANVDLSMRVLTYVEFPEASAGREASIGYQKQKESLAGRR